MKKLLVLVLLIDFSTAIAGEMPRQMLFVNLPDLAQQKLSVSFLNLTKQNNYWQFDVAFRQIYTYEKFYSYKGETEPRFIKPFSSSMGFHLFINAGLKIVKSRKGDADITKYWQPNFCLKFAEEKSLCNNLSFHELDEVQWKKFLNEYYGNYQQCYSFGFELNKGRMKTHKKAITDMYWGIGCKFNYNRFQSMVYWYKESPDFFYHASHINYYPHWTFSPYLNLGIKFGKAL
jgi:hypothetical protein